MARSSPKAISDVSDVASAAVEPPRTGGGGPTAVGGFNFQAAATAIALAHAALGARLGWLSGLAEDIPAAVTAETGGPGDDLRLDLADGKVVEVQVKKGLRAGAAFEAAIDRLALAIHAGDIDFGLLLVDSATSRTIASAFAEDITAMGEGRGERLRPLAVAFGDRLRAAQVDVPAVCARLRVTALRIVREDEGDIRTAIMGLSTLCATPTAAREAWNLLYADAHFMMERRGRRTREAIAGRLRAGGVLLRDNASAPAAVADRLVRFACGANATFSVIGVAKRLPLDRAWMELPIRRSPGAPEGETDLLSALERYHRLDGRGASRNSDDVDAIAIGRFRCLAVVVAGPGMGKSTLVRRLALAYAADGFPVLRARARDIAQRMRSAGSAFDEAVFALGLDGSGVSPMEARGARLSEWVLLIDGLDEAGVDQDLVTEGMAAFAVGQPQARIIATTRPIGYRSRHTQAWRHYEISSLPQDDAPQRLAELLGHLLPPDDPRRRDLRAFAKDALERSRAGRTAARSPLLLSLCAALLARNQPLGATRLAFYREIFRLLEDDRAERSGRPPASPTTLARVRDAIGWLLLSEPTAPSDVILERCAQLLCPELGAAPLAAAETVAACVAYWEQVGVLERIRHGADEALTFVHLTFGEFAAGRFLAQANPTMQAEVLRDEGRLARFSEAIAFAAAQGAGGPLLETTIAQGFAGEDGQARLERALEAATEAEPPLPEDQLAPVIDAAFGCVIGALPQRAAAVGGRLVRLAPRARELLRPHAAGLLTHPYRWSRLIGWALHLACDPDPSDVAAYVTALEDLLQVPDPDDALRTINVGARGLDERSLREDFAIGVAELIVARLPAEAADHALERLFADITHRSFNFLIRMQAVVEGKGLTFDPGKPFQTLRREHALGAEQVRRGIAAFDRGLARLVGMMRMGALAPERTERDRERPLYCLGAMFDHLGLAHMVPAEVSVVAGPFDDRDGAEVLLATAVAAGVPLDGLAADAAEMSRHLAVVGADSLSAIFDRLPKADPPDLDWSRLRSEPDWSRVERMLWSRSVLLAQPAADLVAARADKVFVRRVAADLLRRGKDTPLRVGVSLARLADADVAADLLIEAAQLPHRLGSDEIFRGLTALQVSQHPDRRAAVSAGLGAHDSAVVETAARWICAAPTEAKTAEAALASAAYARWKEEERTWVPEGVSQPPTPRVALLEAMGILGLEGPRLVAELHDDRRDIRETAAALLTPRLAEEAGTRSALVETLLSTDLRIEGLALLLRPDLPYAADEIARLLGLLSSTNAKVRLAALPLLGSQHVSPKTKAHWLAQLCHDELGPIREAATAMTRIRAEGSPHGAVGT